MQRYTQKKKKIIIKVKSTKGAKRIYLFFPIKLAATFN